MYREGELLNCGAVSLGVVQDELVLSTKVVSRCNFSGRMITTLPMRVNDSTRTKPPRITDSDYKGIARGILG